MTTVQINITKEVLEKTANCDEGRAANCAVAYVVRKLIPCAQVSSCLIYINNDPIDYRSIPLPKKATAFIKLFDRLLPNERLLITPFSFNIKISDKILELLVPINEIKESLTLKVIQNQLV